MAEQIIDPEGFTSLRDEEINSETNAPQADRRCGVSLSEYKRGI